jgi:C4-dicarboxylate transporter, DctM subunit
MITALAIIALVLMVIGLPFWIFFLVTSIVVIYFYTNVPLGVVASTMFGSLDNFVLLAVPGFIFAGTVMGYGGMTSRMIRWLRTLVGPVQGGMPLTTITAGELFGAISGSSAASTAALGKILYPALMKEGYSQRFSLGLVTSTGAIAIIIPPSITMILYSSVTGAPVGRLFLAGFIPGILLGIMVASYAIYISYQQKVMRDRKWDWAEIWDSTKEVSWTLGLPIIIFGGIYGGIATPTEAAAIACFYAVIVSAFIYRELSWKGLWEVTRESVVLTAKVFLICAAAGVFSWVLTISQVPQILTNSIKASGFHPWTILLIINIILLIAGMFIDPTSCVLVLTPLFWPIAQVIGADIVHFGIVMVVNMAIGMFSPPFGLNIFVVCALFHEQAGLVARSIIPFAIIYVIGLQIITYMPILSLYLPRLFMG